MINKFLIFGLVSMALTAHSETKSQLVHLKSGKDQINLIELYSSEGCSSCPPADAYVSKLTNDPKLWKAFIPIAFQVDYWNDIGWKDVFSSKKMTERQVSHSRQWSQPSVYTPGFITNGAEWRNWRNQKPSDFANKKTFEIELNETQDLNFNLKIGTNSVLGKKVTVHVALVGFGLVTDVTAGENSGRKLEHNFVVLDWMDKTVNVSEVEKNNFQFKKPTAKYKKLAVVSWVEKENDPTPLQAVGGYL
jgi:hypothetical protein